MRIRRHQAPLAGGWFDTEGRRVLTVDVKGVARVWDACTACTDAAALLRFADQRLTRDFTRFERQTFLAE